MPTPRLLLTGLAKAKLMWPKCKRILRSETGVPRMRKFSSSISKGGSPFMTVSATSSGKSPEVETRRMIYFFAS